MAPEINDMIAMSSHPTEAAAIPAKLNPLQLGSSIADPYHNRSLATVNDHEVRISVMTYGFRWHHHPDSDETFIGVDGQLVIELADGTVTLGPGEMVTVPAGVAHRTRPLGQRSVNLTVERRNAATVFLEPEVGSGSAAT